MKKISVVYWSNAGNVEVLANALIEGAREAGAEVKTILVQEAKVNDVLDADAVAFGSPSLDNNKIEQEYMAPFVKEFKMLPIQNKPTVLFGSYGWDEGAFIKDWEELMVDYGFDVKEAFAVKEAPRDEEIKKAKELGRMLAE